VVRAVGFGVVGYGDDEVAVGSGDAGEFVEGACPVGYVFEDFGAGGDVEGVVGVWEVSGVGALEVEVW